MLLIREPYAVVAIIILIENAGSSQTPNQLKGLKTLKQRHSLKEACESRFLNADLLRVIKTR